MGFDDYISEGEAAGMAGVSANTLLRFAEAGYLQTESDNDGLKLYSREDIKSLFGVMDEAFYSRLADDLNAVSNMSAGGNSAAVAPHEEPAIPEAQSGPRTLKEQIQVSSEPGHANGSTPGRPQRSEAAILLEQELQRLRNLISLQERMLDMRDEQLRDVRQERDWLKTRLEKQELKAERDQLLLLSESQTVRRLVSIQEQRKPLIRSALEWLGFVQPPNAQLQIASTIEGASSESHTQN